MLAAESRLARMDLHEDFAELYETEDSDVLRRRFAKRYRELIGIDPNRRAELRGELERVRDSGSLPVEQVIERLNRPQASGPSSVIGA
jgi:hypothetical protein